MEGGRLRVGVATSISIIIAIVMVIIGRNGAAISTGVGAIVTGVAVTWLVRQRREAQRDMTKAQGVVNRVCA